MLAAKIVSSLEQGKKNLVGILLGASSLILFMLKSWTVTCFTCRDYEAGRHLSERRIRKLLCVSAECMLAIKINY